MLMLFLMNVVVSVCIPFQQAALRLFSAKLEKDASMWSKHCAALSDYTSSQRVGKVEFLRAQDTQSQVCVAGAICIVDEPSVCQTPSVDCSNTDRTASNGNDCTCGGAKVREGPSGGNLSVFRSSSWIR